VKLTVSSEVNCFITPCVIDFQSIATD